MDIGKDHLAISIVTKEEEGVIGAEEADVVHLNLLNQVAEHRKQVLTVPIPSQKASKYPWLVWPWMTVITPYEMGEVLQIWSKMWYDKTTDLLPSSSCFVMLMVFFVCVDQLWNICIFKPCGRVKRSFLTENEKHLMMTITRMTYPQWKQRLVLQQYCWEALQFISSSGYWRLSLTVIFQSQCSFFFHLEFHNWRILVLRKEADRIIES